VNAVTEIAPLVGIVLACAMLAVARATYYRSLRPRALPAARPTPVRALGPNERQAVLDVLHEPRFVDLAPSEVYATLLDEQRYLCSERTMYRILAANQEVRERRDQLRHQNHPRPELLATRPNELWSWDITKLLGPQKWTYFYLYVILDVFSRYVVGWMVAHEESAALARKLIEETCRRQGISPDQLTLHADRGSSMTSKSVALLLADLGVTKTHSRPHVSNDNPFSESAFKTLKYRPGFPERFVHIEHARHHCGPSSTGTTASIATDRSASAPRTTCTTASQPRRSNAAARSSTPPSSCIQNASRAAAHLPRRLPPRSGSTSPRTRPRRSWTKALLSKLTNPLSQPR
jgi:putative transposase